MHTSPTRRPPATFASFALAAALLGGCLSTLDEARQPSGPVVIEPEGAAPTSAEILADWDDADAAVEAALTRCASSVLRDRRYAGGGAGTPPEPIEITLEIVTLRGDEGAIRLRRLDPWNGVDPVRVVVEASVGVFGNRRAEGCLVRAIALRLEQLRGVDYAPLDWSPLDTGG